MFVRLMSLTVLIFVAAPCAARVLTGAPYGHVADGADAPEGGADRFGGIGPGAGWPEERLGEEIIARILEAFERARGGAPGPEEPPLVVPLPGSLSTLGGALGLLVLIGGWRRLSRSKAQEPG